MLYKWEIQDLDGKVQGSFVSREEEDSKYVVEQWINWTISPYLGNKNNLRAVLVDSREE